MIHQNQNDHGGYRNVTIEIEGKGAYGTLKKGGVLHKHMEGAKYLRKKKLVGYLPLKTMEEKKVSVDGVKISGEYHGRSHLVH